MAEQKAPGHLRLQTWVVWDFVAVGGSWAIGFCYLLIVFFCRRLRKLTSDWNLGMCLESGDLSLFFWFEPWDIGLKLGFVGYYLKTLGVRL